MTVSAHDVERAIRSKMYPSGRAQVQKLLYYCQAWYVTFAREPLFTEEIQAWKMGPVVADHWRDVRYELKLPPQAELDPTADGIVAFVVKTYGRYNGAQLIELTHKEQPWLDAYDGAWPNQEITLDSMRAYFGALGKRGEAIHWLERFREADPEAARQAPPAPANAPPDDLDELRRLRSSLATR